MDTRFYSEDEIRQSASDAIIEFYRTMVEGECLSIEDIKNHPAGKEVLSLQTTKASELIGRPQCAFVGFALSGYVNKNDHSYTVICFLGDASEAGQVVYRVREAIDKVEAHYCALN